ncbi:MAG TPA: gliding motility protein GldM [Prolixibacteraceae bacterium]|nr:gliding motility protein GldM [Prolixibacteraceae bacterium]
MGTKYCPEAPRQKMISLMYLVLTAMLALNVDKSVLDAFAMVNNNFMQTIENFTAKNQRVYNDFNNAAKENPQKAGELNKEVLKVKAGSDSLYNYIFSLKEMIVKLADGPEGDVNNIKAQENLNFAAELMITKKHGEELKKAIEAYRGSLLSLIDTSNTELVASINQSLSTDPPPKKEGSSPSWEESKFEGYPLIAVITLMSKIQSDVRNAEGDVIHHLYAQIDASSFKFNKLQAQVVSKSDFVLQGGTYEAKVFLSALDTTIQPEIIVGGSTLSMVPGENAGLYKVNTSKEGKVEWSGHINYKNPDGIIVAYPFKHEYEVAKPSMTVSPTKMNVFYAGLDNPVSVSVPGIAPSNVKVSITNGSIQQGAEGYIVRPDKIGVNSVISVSATIDGTTKVIGSTPFRVKRVPDPVASVAGKIEGVITKNELLAQQGVLAKIPDFDFQMNFTVTSFVVSTSKAGFVVDKATKGNRFSQEQTDLMKGLNPGGRLYIESIVVKGDDGSVRNLPALSFKIN